MPESIYSGKKIPDLEQVRVRLEKGRGYDIIIGFGFLSKSGGILRGCALEGEYYLLSDETVYHRYGHCIEKHSRTLDM